MLDRRWRLTVDAAFDGPFGELSSLPQETPASARINDNVRRIERLLGNVRATLSRSFRAVRSAAEMQSDELTESDAHLAEEDQQPGSAWAHS